MDAILLRIIGDDVGLYRLVAAGEVGVELASDHDGDAQTWIGLEAAFE